MSSLIVPSRHLRQSKEHQLVEEARNTLVVGFQFVLPGSTQVLQANLHQPTPIEGIAMAIVALAAEQIKRREGEAIADRIIGTGNVVN